MFSRRDSLVGGALALVFYGVGTRCGCANSLTPHSSGCLLADKDVDAIYPQGAETRRYIHGDEPIIGKSGNPDFDYALAQTLAKLAYQFEVLPGFAYYDDSGSENAFATSMARLKNVDGTVLMGLSLLKRMLHFSESPEAAVTGVCAHEFGHIVQYRHRLIPIVNAGQKTNKRCELQADYFAGYFAGQRKLERPGFPAAVIAFSQYKFGDTAFTDRGHHGTPEERGAAVVRGFEAAFRERITMSDAIQQSTMYVLNLT
jgi:hypothetical protein